MAIFARYVGKSGATIAPHIAFAAFGITPTVLMNMVAPHDKKSFPAFTPTLTQAMSVLAVLKAMASNTVFNPSALAELEATNG
jgi:hypothetical protein